MTTSSEPLPYLVALRAIPRWCRWQLRLNDQGKLVKRPDQSTSELCECRDWIAAAHTITRVNDKRVPGAPVKLDDAGGVGFVMMGGVTLADGSSVIALDIDSCIREDGTIVPEVDALLSRFNTATEVTPSGFGLRVWLSTRPPEPGMLARLRAITRATWAPTLETKRAEIQLFAVSGYVTVTGEHVEGTPTDIRPVPWDVLTSVIALEPDVPVAQVQGEGTPPTTEELRAAVEEWKKGPQLLEARWEGLNYASASEAYFALIAVLLRAARGWQAHVVEFLLTETHWGHGWVAESRDPGKYTRRKWVTAEVGRAVAKGAGSIGSELFEPLDEEPEQLENEGPGRGTTGASPSHTSSLVSAAPSPAPEVDPHATPEPAQPQAPAATPPATPSAGRGVKLGELFRTPHQLWVETRPSELWARMLPCRGIAVWYGAPKCGKTYLALGLACAIAEGKPFLGRSTLQGRVLYFAGEGVRGVADKIAAVIGPDRMADPADPIHQQLVIYPGMPRLTDAALMRRVLAEVEHWGGVELVIIDTVARAVGAAGLDENDQAAMNSFVAVLDGIRDNAGAAVLGLHHENKSGGDRGSTVLRAACDMFARVSRARRKCSSLVVEDLRDGEPQDPIDVVWEDVHVRTDEHGPVLRWKVQAIAVKPEFVDHDEELVLTALQRATRPWRAGDFAAELPQVKKTKRQQVLAKLYQAGLVDREGDGAKTVWKARAPFDPLVEPLNGP